MAYAKRAALAVLDQLGERDLVATIAFDSQPYELGPLLPAGESRAALAAKIQQIQYGGGTDFKEALDIARRNLVASGAHGPPRDPARPTATATAPPRTTPSVIAALARAEITVTSIRIGSDDREPRSARRDLARDRRHLPPRRGRASSCRSS